ncbi:MAG: hypothetical protein [Bacteriophage sp.]|nr:MAG: hypothetical protein [Bacteriophage sp.]
MAGQRELSFDEDETDHVAQVLTDMNAGRYDRAREYISKLDKETQSAVRRSIATRTNVYL